MKKTLTLITIAAFALLSCSKEADQATEAEQATATELVTVTACFDEEDAIATRTVLAEDRSVLWSEGDAISIFTNDGENVRFDITSGAGTSKASFTGELKKDSAPFYAIYPYAEDISISEGSAIQFAMPQVQTYVPGSFGNGAAPMYAVFLTLESEASFRNLCGVLDLQFTGVDSVTSIKVTAKGESLLWGNCSLALDGNQGTDNQTLNISGGSSSLTLDCGAGVQLSSEPAHFHIALPAGSLPAGMTVEVYAAGNITLASFTTDNDIIITRSGITHMKPRAIAPDLSSVESANCYIVNAAGDYRFKAVKGNSQDAVVPASVEVLWESVNTKTAPDAGTIICADPSPYYKDGYIFFTAAGEKGNALIAAKDGEGNVLWSWHIWAPATVPQLGDMMDRDLGALAVTEGSTDSNGWLYQWGRKDPFPGNAEYSTANKEMASTGIFTYESTSAEKGTMEYATAHPMEYLYCATSVQSNQDWVYGGNKTNWGAAKTVNDPCPPGYKVPANGIWAGLEIEPGTWGFKLDGKYWYSVSGYRWSSNGTLHSTNAMGYWWNSTAGTNQANYALFDYTKGTFTPAKTIARSAGLAVRCGKADIN